MRSRVLCLIGILWLVFFLISTACNDSPMSASPVQTRQEEVIVNVVQTEEQTTDGPTDCEAINITTRRSGGDNTVILQVDPTIAFDRLYAKFLIDDNGIVRILHIERGITPSERMEVLVPLPQCGVEHQVFVYVEGTIGDRLYQCDGSVTLEEPCEKPPPPPPPGCVQTERPGDECVWDEVACEWICVPPPPPPPPPPSCPEPTPEQPGPECIWIDYPECRWECPPPPPPPPPPPMCVAPPEQSGAILEFPPNQEAACQLFGDYTATEFGEAAFYITQCAGSFFELTHAPFTAAICSNGGRAKASFACYCPEE